MFSAFLNCATYFAEASSFAILLRLESWNAPWNGFASSVPMAMWCDRFVGMAKLEEMGFLGAG